MKSCCFLAAFAVLHAQGQVPRLADGHPDLGGDGVWLPMPVADMAPKAEAPFQAWARLKFRENQAVKQSETDLRCLPPGVPRIMLMPRPFQIVETPTRILFLFEGGAHVWRQVWMDGRAHPKEPNPNWLGHSIGRWEGDTLVVDSVGFNDRTWLDDAGHPHTERLHVIEKFARTGPLAMKYDVVIDDPGAYSQSWTSGTSFSFRRGEKLAEDICLDKISKAGTQPSAEAPRFEVASVRPVSAPARFNGSITGGPGGSDPERLTFSGVPMMRLLMSAYGIPFGAISTARRFGPFSDQISGPAWIESEWYDINAKVPPGATQEQVNLMLQNLLAERFGLRLHHETREAAGYELVVGRNGPKLKPTSDPNAKGPNDAPTAGTAASKPAYDQDGFPVIPQGLSATRFSAGDGDNNMHVTGNSQSISNLLLTIMTSLNDGKRVVDKTGLTGKYDFKMDLGVDGGFRRPGLPPLTPDEPVGPDIFTALDKFLGLKLQKAQIPIDVLVIDHLDKAPSEN